MRYVLIFALLIFLVGTFFLFGSSDKNGKTAQIQPTSTIQKQFSEDQTVSFAAGFAIFTNGTFRIFTDTKYHNLSPDMYISSENPNVVQVRKKGITWQDFFNTLPMQLSKACLVTGTKQTFCTNETVSLKFYLNGVSDDAALERSIQQGDQLLVSYGSESEQTIKQQMQRIPSPN